MKCVPGNMLPGFLDPQFSRLSALCAKRAQAERVIALCEADTLGVGHEWAVEKRGFNQAKSAVQQELAASAREKIRTAHDFGDSHVADIDRAGELVAGQVVFSPDEEVAEILPGDFRM